MAPHRAAPAGVDWADIASAVELDDGNVKVVLREAVRLYWRRRPNPTEQCGSWLGYRTHRRRGDKACEPCRKAYAMCMAIWRLREARGLNRNGSPREPRYIQPPLVASVPTGPRAEHDSLAGRALAGDRQPGHPGARGGAADPASAA